MMALAFFILSGCESVGLHNPFRADQVPDPIKAQPRIVESAPPLTGQEKWPRLGDVPMMPNSFSTPTVYDHYMDQLEFERDEGKTAKAQVAPETPAAMGVAPATSAGVDVVAAPIDQLSAPQFQRVP